MPMASFCPLLILSFGSFVLDLVLMAAHRSFVLDLVLMTAYNTEISLPKTQIIEDLMPEETKAETPKAEKVEAKKGGAPAADKKEQEGVSRRPQAMKRAIQNRKARFANRSFKAEVRTAIRVFVEGLAKGDVTSSRQQLNMVYKLMDKGVQKGVFKVNKASRIKARMTARLSAKA